MRMFYYVNETIISQLTTESIYFPTVLWPTMARRMSAPGPGTFHIILSVTLLSHDSITRKEPRSRPNVKIMTRASGNPGGGFGDSGCRVYDRLAPARVTHVTARRLVGYFVKIMIIILK